MNTKSKIHEALAMLGAAAKTTVVDVAVAEALNELAALQSVEQEQAEKIRALEGKLALVMGERDAAASNASMLEQSVAAQKHVISELREQLRLAHDKMAEQVRQARWEVADEAIGQERWSSCVSYLQSVLDANPPKD